MNFRTVHRYVRGTRAAAGVFLSLLLLLGATAFAGAPQKEKKKKKDDSTADKPLLPDQQQIDYMISSMLGAWQVNDVERLHECYADDATFVSGTWAPLVMGWANYLPLYQQQRARAKQVRMERSNTLIRVEGTIGWASYQWDFSGVVDNQPMVSQGQTTLIVQKRNNRWLIVHDHTSVAQVPRQVPAAAPGNTPTASPQPQTKPPSR